MCILCEVLNRIPCGVDENRHTGWSQESTVGRNFGWFFILVLTLSIRGLTFTWHLTSYLIFTGTSSSIPILMWVAFTSLPLFQIP